MKQKTQWNRGRKKKGLLKKEMVMRWPPGQKPAAQAALFQCTGVRHWFDCSQSPAAIYLQSHLPLVPPSFSSSKSSLAPSTVPPYLPQTQHLKNHTHLNYKALEIFICSMIKSFSNCDSGNYIRIQSSDSKERERSTLRSLIKLSHSGQEPLKLCRKRAWICKFPTHILSCFDIEWESSSAFLLFQCKP